MSITRLFCVLMLDVCVYNVTGQTVTLPASSTVVLGESFQLTCTVTGGPDPSTPRLMKYKNGSTTVCSVNSANCSQIQPKPRFSCGAQSCGSGQTRVYFLNINPVSLKDDRDDWQCQYNAKQSIGSLTVNYPPSITSSFPSTYNVIEQRRLTIDCNSYTTAGKPAQTSYVWRHPGGSTTSTLDISRINRSQSGQYTCTASNTLLLGRQGEVSDTVAVTVQYEPTISTTFPSSYPVGVLSPVQIDCSSHTSPGIPTTTSYRWTGPNSFSSNGPVLSISSITNNQAGLYTCTVTNTLTPTGGAQATGTDSRQVNVQVRDKPAITGIPDPYHVTENSNLRLDCSTYTHSHPPVTSYSWSGPGDYSSNGPVLSITNTNRDKSGQYTCSATNNIGTGTGQTRVNVQYKPDITGLPNPFHVTENTTFRLNCSSYTQSNPTVTSYSWSGPGGYSHSGPVLSITNINRDKSGQYMCSATNTLTPTGGSVGTGSGSSNIRVDVQYPPSVNLPASHNVTEFTDLQINCGRYTAPGNPNTTSYSWSGPGGYSSNGPVLSNTNINRDKTGEYMCTANNALTPTGGSVGTGSDFSNIRVDVQYGPGTSISFSPGPTVEREEGSGPLTVTCSATCNPPCQFKWIHENRETQSHQLDIPDVRRSNQGDYTCEVWNGIRDAKQKHFKLIVFYLDNPFLTMDKTEVMEKDRVNISCDVVSNPTAQMTITNTDNNTVLVKETTNSKQMTINQVQCLHNGTYVCSGQNQRTNTQLTNTRSLSVLCSPRKDFRVKLNNTVAKDFNQSAILIADFIANPAPNFTWYRNSDGKLSPVGNQTVHAVTSTDFQSRLEITITDSRDYSDYAVVAQNAFGNFQSNFTLTATSPPYPPTSLTVIIKGAKFLSVEWVSEFNGGAAQTFHLSYQTQNTLKLSTIDAIQDPGRNKTVAANITGLSPDTSYYIQLYANNIFGNSMVVTVNTTTIAEKIPPVTPLNLGAIVGGLGAALLVIIVVAVIIILHQRGVIMSKEKKNKDVALFENGQVDERPVMEDNVLYAGAGDASSSGITTEVYAEVKGKKGKGGKKGNPNKEGKSKEKNEPEGDVYAKPMKKGKISDRKDISEGDIYAKPEKQGKQGKGKGKDKKDGEKKNNKKTDNKKEKRSKQTRGDVYENTMPGQFAENTYANAGFVDDEPQSEGAAKAETPAYGRDEDGLLYVGIDFSNQKPNQEVHGTEESTEYAAIAFGKVGQPLPPDEEEKDKDKN